jgi:phage tail sheath protein FI
MPEYLAPGVYVEEVSYRSKSIEGVSTSTTGFIGPTRYGPTEQDLEVLTSLLEFERIYGDRQPLVFSVDEAQVTTPNYMWQAARAYFENGGARLYVKRIFTPVGSDGRASGFMTSEEDEGYGKLRLKARFPGAAGARRVQFTLQRGPNVAVQDQHGPRLVGVHDRDMVLVIPPAADGSYSASAPFAASGSATAALYSARLSGGVWGFIGAPEGGNAPGSPQAKTLDDFPGATIHVVTVTVTDHAPDPDAIATTWPALPPDPDHERAGRPDSVFSVFTERPANSALALRLPVIITPDDGADAVEITTLMAHAVKAGSDHPSTWEALLNPLSTNDDRSFYIELSAGNDGGVPPPTAYEGEEDPDSGVKRGLVALEDIDDISIVAAPGSSLGYEADDRNRLRVTTIQQNLIAHCDRMRYRIAVLDSGDGQTVSQVRQMKARIDSTYAALYYPWVTAVDPVTQNELQLPPSGFVCGIYARNDIQRAVYKAPANEVVNLAVGFEKMINKGQQDVLNPEGVNCFRYFPRRGMRLWGARTTSSDPEWKYVNVRRYFAYLEHSIDRGTQWAVFEPNGERLWANLRRTIEDFLFNEWQMGALLGDKPERAYFVKCDRTTMTQNDLDNGRLVCQIGVAPLRPAEFVIFRIGQWTADRRA